MNEIIPIKESAINNKEFWFHVDILDESKCWRWTGILLSDGYGCFRIDRYSYRAHRIAYTIKHGTIPEGKHILHACDNPPCVNPAHLFCGTNYDNVQDKMKKGRWGGSTGQNVNVGEDHGQTKLTNTMVKEIRKVLSGGETLIKTAIKYNTTYAIIHGIKEGLTWKHLGGKIKTRRPGRYGKLLSASDINDIAMLFERGVSTDNIAKRLNVSVPTIYKKLKELQPCHP